MNTKKMLAMDDIEMNDEFKKCIDVIENTTQNLFITGGAGTGKTTLLRCVRERTKKRRVVLATTGVAALNCDAQTVHSFFRLAPTLVEKVHIHPDSDLRNILQSLELLIVDEASMMRADLMDGIDHALRISRKKMKVPFGGLQIVLFGDLHQLQPILSSAERPWFNHLYITKYFFSAIEFQEAKFRQVTLTKIYRQKDHQFQKILNKVRNNTAGPAELKILNSRVDPKACQSSTDCITLTPRKAVAKSKNEVRLARLKGEKWVHRAHVDGDFPKNARPTDDELELKVGAQIMMVKNDPEHRWVNGSVGEVISLEEDFIKVKIGNKAHVVVPVTWEQYDPGFNPVDENGKLTRPVIGRFRQYPVKLAWAITIHKSQGLTLDKVIIDLDGGAFTHGQAYVALSRCSSLEGLFLQRPIKEADIICDPHIRCIRFCCPDFV